MHLGTPQTFGGSAPCCCNPETVGGCCTCCLKVVDGLIVQQQNSEMTFVIAGSSCDGPIVGLSANGTYRNSIGGPGSGCSCLYPQMFFTSDDDPGTEWGPLAGAVLLGCDADAGLWSVLSCSVISAALYLSTGVAAADFCTDGGVMANQNNCSLFQCDDWPATITVVPTGTLLTCLVDCPCILSAIPSTLHLTIDSPEVLLDGKIITLTRSGDVWSGQAGVSCADCDLILASLSCTGGVLSVTIAFSGTDTCPFSGMAPCTSTQLITSIRPFQANGTYCYPNVGSPQCFAAGSFDWVLTS